MIRRRLIIEWDDEGCDTDEDCLESLMKGEWGIEDLFELRDEVNLVATIQDAPKEKQQ